VALFRDFPSCYAACCHSLAPIFFTKLVVLRKAALALERTCAATGGIYESMNSDARATIIKCLFKPNDLTGFSKLSSKAKQFTIFGEQGDACAFLEVEVIPRASPRGKSKPKSLRPAAQRFIASNQRRTELYGLLVSRVPCTGPGVYISPVRRAHTARARTCICLYPELGFWKALPRPILPENATERSLSRRMTSI
jgi:hypothetical protein